MMTDPIADMLTRVRNAQAASKVDVTMPSSKLKLSIAKVLQDEGYIAGYSSDNAVKPTLTVTLKYYEGRPVIDELKRISRPGLRIYKNKNELPKILKWFRYCHCVNICGCNDRSRSARLWSRW